MRLALGAPQREAIAEMLAGAAVAFGEAGEAKGILTRSGRLISKAIACGIISSIDRGRGIFMLEDGTGELAVGVAGELKRQALAELQEGDFVQVLGKLRRPRTGGAILLDANVRKYNEYGAEVLKWHAAEIQRQREKDAYLLGVARKIMDQAKWNYLVAKTIIHSKPLRSERGKGLCARHLRAAQAARRRL